MFLILHGETALNVAGRCQGRCDSPLTANGRAQAQALAGKLRQLVPVGPDPRIVSSPRGRCCGTATIVGGGLGIPTEAIETDPRLDEVDLGVWEGLTEAEIKERWPLEIEGATDADWYFHAPGGERYDDVERRLGDWLRALGPHDRLIVVGHGISSQVLRGLYAELSAKRALELDIDRDAVFVLEGGEITKVAAR
jgi:broad specificity phosphatase PhoE